MKMKTAHKKRTLPIFILLAVLVVLVAAAGVFLLVEPSGTKIDADIPILMYHHVIYESEAGDTIDGTVVTAERLEQNLIWLQENGYQTVLPRELASGEPLPEKPIMITFDDGYRSNYTLLFPLLQKYQMKASISIIVKNQDNESINHLSWDMCREMTDSGLVEIDSHTYDLHKENDDGSRGIGRKTGERRPIYWLRLLPDLLKSVSRIKSETGMAPAMLAYPYGVSEATALAPVHRIFSLTVSTTSGLANLSDGLYELPRYAVKMDTDFEEILTAEK